MLELCLGLQPFRSRLAVDNGTIAGFRSGTATLGCALTALALWGRLEAKSHPAEFGFTMNTLHSRVGNREGWKIGASHIATASFLESTLAENRRMGLPKATAILKTRQDLSLVESDRCTLNKDNSFRLIFLQKKVGGTPPLK
jgi:hypothetical protein